MFLLIGTGSQVSDMAHGPLVGHAFEMSMVQKSMSDQYNICLGSMVKD